MAICKACQGAGIIERELKKRADKNDDWRFSHDGWKYRQTVCKKCKGKGEI